MTHCGHFRSWTFLFYTGLFFLGAELFSFLKPDPSLLEPDRKKEKYIFIIVADFVKKMFSSKKYLNIAYSCISKHSKHFFADMSAKNVSLFG